MRAATVTRRRNGDVSAAGRVFTCPEDGGYVCERVGRKLVPVFAGLGASGAPLVCAGRIFLFDLIRREAKKLPRQEQSPP